MTPAGEIDRRRLNEPGRRLVMPTARPPWARALLERWRPSFRIVWTDPISGTLRIMAPSAHWLAWCMVRHGCSEAEAMVRLAVKEAARGHIPAAVLEPDRTTNRPRLALVHRKQIPADRRFRDAWRIDYADNDS